MADVVRTSDSQLAPSSSEADVAAGSIFTVLANIPWKTVIENAPKVAEGTVKLWNTVSGWRKSDPVQNTPTDAPIEQAASTNDALLKRVQALEDSVSPQRADADVLRTAEVARRTEHQTRPACRAEPASCGTTDPAGRRADRRVGGHRDLSADVAVMPVELHVALAIPVLARLI